MDKWELELISTGSGALHHNNNKYGTKLLALVVGAPQKRNKSESEGFSQRPQTS